MDKLALVDQSEMLIGFDKNHTLLRISEIDPNTQFKRLQNPG